MNSQFNNYFATCFLSKKYATPSTNEQTRFAIKFTQQAPSTPSAGTKTKERTNATTTPENDFKIKIFSSPKAEK